MNTELRINGRVINARIVMAGAEPIVTMLAPHKLECYGGHIDITKSFEKSLVCRMSDTSRSHDKHTEKSLEQN